MVRFCLCNCFWSLFGVAFHFCVFFFFQAEDGIRDLIVTGVQTCALPILNVPNPFVPAQFFIANAAGAVSNGVELEVNARPDPRLDLFGGAGFTSAHFSRDRKSTRLNSSHDQISYAVFCLKKKKKDQHTLT